MKSKWGIFASFVNFPLAFWISFACPLHDGCLLSLLEPISGELDSLQIWLMERTFIPINGYYWWCLVSGWRSIQLEFSSISLFSHSFFSIPSYSHVMVHLLEWCLRFDESIWFPILGIWCMDLYSYFHILYNSKYKKSICEKLAFPCSRIISFNEFGFHLERVLYHICMRVLL